MIPILAFFCILCLCAKATWLSKEVAEWAIAEFEAQELLRSKVSFRGTDRRPSTPFISGDGFRSYCAPHICEDSNRCRMSPEDVKNGSCVFVKTDMFDYFVKDVAPRIPGSYVIVSHNGDLSAPDGQNDAPRIGMPAYVTSDILEREYAAGRLLAHHGQNLWWKNISHGRPRPIFSHCLPIGFENRQYTIGRNVAAYAHALRRNIVQKHALSIEEQSRKPLLLVAFYPKSRVPDRHKVLVTIGAIPPRGKPKLANPFYNETDLNHEEWLDAITQHRFVLAPFGHGLDTHRVSEILLMGGIPVMRRSSISSCYDDSDNNLGNTSRGSLPIVLLDSWQDLTKETLEREWERISKVPQSTWDWKRLFIDHWLQRIKATQVGRYE